MPFLEILDCRLEYEWHGPSSLDAPTLVFLHEGLGSVAKWKDFPKRVADATGFSALVYSRAGYGASDPVPLPRPVRFMHDEAVQTLPLVLEAMQIRDAILIGHSDGGSIALIYAGTRTDRRIRALVLEAPHVFVEDITVKSSEAARHSYEANDLKRRLARYHRNVDNTFWGWNQVWLNPEFRSWNIEEYLPKIRLPVLVIQGEEDNFGTLRQVEALERGCAGPVQKRILPDCGHSPHRDHPESVLQMITDFVNGL